MKNRASKYLFLCISGVFVAIPTIVWLYSIEAIPKVPITSLVFVIILWLSVSVTANQLIYDRISFKINGFYHIVFSIMFTLFALIIFSNYWKGDVIDKMGTSVFITNVNMLMYMIVYYLFGFYYVKFSKCYTGQFTRLLHLLFYFLVLFYLSNSDFKTFSLNFSTHASGEIYLWLADVFALFAINIFFFTENSMERLLVFLLALLVMFLIGSRASLFFFVASIVFCLVFKSKRSLWLIPLLAVVLLLILLTGDILYSMFPRMFFLFSYRNLINDPSLIYRIEYLKVGYKQILINPFWGDYYGVVRDTGYVGGYMHNVFSYWQSFGVISFIIVVIVSILNPIIVVIRNRWDCTKVTKIYSAVSVFTILQLLLSRSYTWPYVWILVGMTAAYVQRTKETK